MKIARVERDGKPVLIGKQDGEWFRVEGPLEELYAGNPDKGEDFEIEEGDTFLPPIVPGKIVAIGKNYPEHAKELTGGEVKNPTIFLKPDTALAGQNDEITIPSWAQKLDFEVELVTIIGKVCRNVTAEEAHGRIFGFTVGNELGDRAAIKWDYLKTLAKGYDRFAPIGPYAVTVDETGHTPERRISLKLNGGTMQDSSTSKMGKKPPEIIEYISEFMTLNPGDIIFSGTPPGVGHFRDPPIYLKDGDVTECTIEGIGTLVNRFRI